MTPQLFFAFAGILLLAASLAGIFKFFRLPLILAYILSGALISLFGLASEAKDSFEFFSQVAISLLLFIVGAQLNFFEVRKLARTILWGTIAQILTTFTIFFLVALSFGFSPVFAFYIGLSFSFSSTIVVVKILSEKKDESSLYGRLAIGFLLLQDLFAVLVLILMTAIGEGGLFLGQEAISVLGKGIFLIVFLFLLWRYLSKIILKYLATNFELLFLSSIAFCLFLASMARFLGFSFEIGAFLAGLLVGSSPYQLAILARVKPLRDFFLVLFFIFLGLKITASQLLIGWPALIAFSFLVILGKTLIVILTLHYLGEARRNAFLVGISLSQISEFSIIVILLAQTLRHVDEFLVSLVSFVAIVTIFFSSILLVFSKYIYRYLSSYLRFMGKERIKEEEKEQELENHAILVGCDRMGEDILVFLESKMGQDFVVIDFNPQIYEKLKGRGVPVIFGDIADPEILEKLKLAKAKILISTVPDLEDNLHLIHHAKVHKFQGPKVFVATTNEEAKRLYKAGADFVIIPHVVGGKHLAYLLEGQWDDLSKLAEYKEKHLAELIGE